MDGFRARGIGSRLIQDLFAKAETESKPVLLSVVRNNSAVALYRRLGFRVIEALVHERLMTCKAARIEPSISFHVLRHTHGSLLAMEGVPMLVVARQLGHADTRITEKHYAHLSPDYVADTIRAHFPTLGIGGRSKVARLA